MAKQTFYYSMTPADWAAAQARGYLLESCTGCTKTTAECWAECEQRSGDCSLTGMRRWTYLRPSGWIPTLYFQGEVPAHVEATIRLRVQYEVKVDDVFLCGDVMATGQISLDDVTVEE